MTTTIVTIASIAWVCGCLVGIGIGGKLAEWRVKRENERKFVEKHKRSG
jgi:hypothetical protein